MLTIEQIRHHLEDANLRKVADKLDLHYMTLWRFMRGQNNPCYSTVKVLSDYIIRRQTGEVANG